MEKIDISIIGAGIIGLAIAKEVSDHFKNYRICVFEKQDSFGRETSSRNSEVMHGGMYYQTGSLKARLCVEGRKLLQSICRTKNIPYRKTGKLIVATNKDEISSLERLLKQGEANAVEGLRMLSEKELKKIEPNVYKMAGLLSEETGIIDSHKLMEYFLNSAKDNGVIISFNAEVIRISKLNDGYRISIINNKEIVEIKTSVVINAAGLDADEIAAKVGIDIKKYEYELKYCKGDYFRVNNIKAKQINTLVYPVSNPKSGGLGIHATLDLGGGLRLGPDDKYQNNRIKDYAVDSGKKHIFYASASKFLPFLEEEDLSVDISGIRPKLQKEGGDFRDFVIQDEAEKGYPAFIDLIGIESPGLTASMAIAKYVRNLIQ